MTIYFASMSVEIKDSDYHEVNIKEVIGKCNCLLLPQHRDLEQLLSKYTTLFNGKLRLYPHAKIHLDIKPDAKPVHQRHYPLPRVYYDTFKHELDWLIEIGVLEPGGPSA